MISHYVIDFGNVTYMSNITRWCNVTPINNIEKTRLANYVILRILVCACTVYINTSQCSRQSIFNFISGNWDTFVFCGLSQCWDHQVVAILPHVREAEHSWYHGCWCPGNTRSQGICRHDIDPFNLKYSVFSFRKVKASSPIHLTVADRASWSLYITQVFVVSEWKKFCLESALWMRGGTKTQRSRGW